MFLGSDEGVGAVSCNHALERGSWHFFTCSREGKSYTLALTLAGWWGCCGAGGPSVTWEVEPLEILSQGCSPGHIFILHWCVPLKANFLALLFIWTAFPHPHPPQSFLAIHLNTNLYIYSNSGPGELVMMIVVYVVNIYMYDYNISICICICVYQSVAASTTYLSSIYHLSLSSIHLSINLYIYHQSIIYHLSIYHKKNNLKVPNVKNCLNNIYLSPICHLSIYLSFFHPSVIYLFIYHLSCIVHPSIQ